MFNSVRRRNKKMNKRIPKAEKKFYKRYIKPGCPPEQRGFWFERYIKQELYKSDLKFEIEYDKYLKTSSGNTSQSDFIIATKKAIYVLECKCYEGVIFVDHDSVNSHIWDRPGKEAMKNPCLQNENHINVLLQDPNINKDIPIYNIVVFEDIAQLWEGKNLWEVETFKELHQYKYPTYVCHDFELLKLLKTIDNKLNNEYDTKCIHNLNYITDITVKQQHINYATKRQGEQKSLL